VGCVGIRRRPPHAAPRFGFEALHPLLRGIRFVQSPPNGNSSYDNWGSQVKYGWLDK